MRYPGELYDEEMDDEFNPDGPFNPVYDALMSPSTSMLDEYEEDEMGLDFMGDDDDLDDDDFGDDDLDDDDEFGGRRSRYARLATRYIRSVQSGKERRSHRAPFRSEDPSFPDPHLLPSARPRCPSPFRS